MLRHKTSAYQRVITALSDRMIQHSAICPDQIEAKRLRPETPLQIDIVYKIALFHITDLLQMFKGARTVDMSTLSNVKFDRGDARMLARNYARMVSLCPAA